MMLSKAKFLLIFLFSCSLSLLSAQNIPGLNAEQLRAEIVKRGYDPEMVEARMKARGFDLKTITTEEMPAAQSALGEVLKELDAEKESSQKAHAELPTTVPSDQEPGHISSPKMENLKVPTSESDTVSAIDPKPALIYGQQIFRDKRLDIYRQTNEIQAPENYILSTGDKIVVSIWGTLANYNEQLEVNTEGYVAPKNLSRVYLRGLSFEKARKQLRAAFAQRYPVDVSNFDVSLALARSISVNITGEVSHYGNFKLSALNTAFHALVAAGGPSDIGSVRNIMLYRNGQAPRRIDVYEYLLNPSLSANFYLEQNDNIFVPVSERTVSISGAVKRPFRYELIPGENLKKLIDWAGGLNDDAYTSSIQVSRIKEQKRVIQDVDLRSLLANKQDFELQAGDIVSIKSINSEVENFVFADGAVDYLGKYELRVGMRVSDLLKEIKPKREARLDYAYLLRKKNDGTIQYISINIGEIQNNPASTKNLALEAQDRLRIFTQSRFVDNAQVSSEGAVRAASSFPYDFGRSIRISDLIELSGGLRPDATDFAYIERIFAEDPMEKSYIRVENIRAILANPAASENLKLEPFDKLKVMSRATFTDAFKVTVGGGVRNPGAYQYDESLRMQDLITMAGGFAFGAATNRIDVFRVEITANQPTKTIIGTFEVDDNFNIINAGDFRLQPYDIIEVRYVPEFELQRMVKIEGEVRFPGSYALLNKNEKITQLIERSGGLAPEAFPAGATLQRSYEGTGYIVIHLDEVLKNPGSRENFALKAGDVLKIPKSKDLVSIIGATRAADLYLADVAANKDGLKVAFVAGKRARYYINDYAGGFGDDANKRKVSVRYPNGQLRRTKNYGLFKLYPKVLNGSTINIPVKPIKPKKEKPKDAKDIDWDKKLTQILAVAAAITQGILAYAIIKSTK